MPFPAAILVFRRSEFVWFYTFREFFGQKTRTEGRWRMPRPRMDLPAFVGNLMQEQDGDVVRDGVRALAQALMEAEVAELVGAERHERTDERTG